MDKIIIPYILPMLGIMTPLIFGLYYQLKKKNMIYQVLSADGLLYLTKKDKDIKISVRGRNIKDIQLSIIRFKSTGFESIQQNDFQGPLEIEFPEGSKTISVETLSINPGNIEVHGSFKSNKVFVNPCLLNRGDVFEAYVMLTNFSGSRKDVKVSGRINGISKIRRADNTKLIYSYLPLIVGLLIGSLPLLLLKKYPVDYLLNRAPVDEKVFLAAALFIILVSLSVALINLLKLKSIYDD